MKEPQHPPGPAFEQARDEQEAWRRQQIAALTADQRERYETLSQQHDNEIEARRVELRADERDQIAEHMRRQASEKGAPTFEVGGKSNAISRQEVERLQNAVRDYVEGKETPETRAHKNTLQSMHAKALHDVTRRQTAELEPLQKEKQNETDGFLMDCARERQREEREQQAIATEPAKSEASKDRSQDEAWRAAVLKAAKRQAERSKDHELTKSFNESR